MSQLALRRLRELDSRGRVVSVERSEVTVSEVGSTVTGDPVALASSSLRSRDTDPLALLLDVSEMLRLSLPECPRFLSDEAVLLCSVLDSSGRLRRTWVAFSSASRCIRTSPSGGMSTDCRSLPASAFVPLNHSLKSFHSFFFIITKI